MKNLSLLSKVFLSIVFVFIMANVVTVAIPELDGAETLITAVLSSGAVVLGMAAGVAAFSGVTSPNMAALIANIADPEAFVDKVVNYMRIMGAGSFNLDKTLGDYVAFDSLQIKGLTTIKYFTGARGAASQSNLPSSFVAPQSEHMLITAIEFMQSDDTAAAWGAVDLEPGISDPNLLNATLDISVNGVSMLKSFPLNNFRQVVEQKGSGLTQLLTPIVWPGQTELIATVSVPTANATANNIWLQIKLHGIKFFS